MNTLLKGETRDFDQNLIPRFDDILVHQGALRKLIAVMVASSRGLLTDEQFIAEVNSIHDFVSLDDQFLLRASTHIKG